MLQIGRIYAERCPVVLSADKQRLNELGFQRLRKRELLSLVMVGQWRDAASGEKMMTEGEPATSIPISGPVNIQCDGRPLAAVAAGEVVGTAMAFTGLRRRRRDLAVPGRYIWWHVAALRAFFDK